VGLTQQRASVWPCAVEALLRLELLVLLLQGKRTKKIKAKCLFGVDFPPRSVSPKTFFNLRLGYILLAKTFCLRKKIPGQRWGNLFYFTQG
jgi:hypothetical protein